MTLLDEPVVTPRPPVRSAGLHTRQKRKNRSSRQAGRVQSPLPPLGLTKRPSGTARAPSGHFSPISLPLLLKYHSNRQRLGSRDTTAALQAFPFVTETVLLRVGS